MKKADVIAALNQPYTPRPPRTWVKMILIALGIVANLTRDYQRRDFERRITALEKHNKATIPNYRRAPKA